MVDCSLMINVSSLVAKNAVTKPCHRLSCRLKNEAKGGENGRAIFHSQPQTQIRGGQQAPDFAVSAADLRGRSAADGVIGSELENLIHCLIAFSPVRAPLGRVCSSPRLRRLKKHTRDSESC